MEGRGKERERERERETEKQRERQRDDESSKDKAASEGVWEQKTTCKARLRRSLVCILFLPLLFARLPQIAVNTHTHTHTQTQTQTHTFDESELRHSLSGQRRHELATLDDYLVHFMFVAR